MMGKVSFVGLISFVLVLSGVSGIGVFRTRENFITMNLGGVRGFNGLQNDAEIETLARFAVQEHNKKENSLLEFSRVLEAKEQVVSGKIYYISLEAIDAGNKRVYEAKIWVKPWMNFKQLQKFKLAPGFPSFTASDLGVKRGH